MPFFFFPSCRQDILDEIETLDAEVKGLVRDYHNDEDFLRKYSMDPDPCYVDCCAYIRDVKLDERKSDMQTCQSRLEVLKELAGKGDREIREFADRNRSDFTRLFREAVIGKTGQQLSSGTMNDVKYFGLLGMNAVCACFMTKHGMSRNTLDGYALEYPGYVFIEETMVESFTRLKAPLDMVFDMFEKDDDTGSYEEEFNELAGLLYTASVRNSVLLYDVENRSFHILADLMR